MSNTIIPPQSEEFKKTASSLLKKKEWITNAWYDDTDVYADKFLKIDVTYSYDVNKAQAQLRTFGEHRIPTKVIQQRAIPIRHGRKQNDNEIERINKGLMDDIFFVFGTWIGSDKQWKKKYKYYFPKVWMCKGKDLRLGIDTGESWDTGDGELFRYIAPANTHILR